MTNKQQANTNNIPRFEYELALAYIEQNKYTDPHIQELLRKDISEAGYCYEEAQLQAAADRVQAMIMNEAKTTQHISTPQIHRAWVKFNLLFGLILLIRATGLLISYPVTSEISPARSSVTLIIVVITTAWMPYILWSYYRKLTGRRDIKWYWLLGFIWSYWFGPLMAYFFLWKAKTKAVMQNTSAEEDYT